MILWLALPVLLSLTDIEHFPTLHLEANLLLLPFMLLPLINLANYILKHTCRSARPSHRHGAARRIRQRQPLLMYAFAVFFIALLISALLLFAWFKRLTLPFIGILLGLNFLLPLILDSLAGYIFHLTAWIDAEWAF